MGPLREGSEALAPALCVAHSGFVKGCVRIPNWGTIPSTLGFNLNICPKSSLQALVVEEEVYKSMSEKLPLTCPAWAMRL